MAKGEVNNQTLPSPYYLSDNIQDSQPGPWFKLQRESELGWHNARLKIEPWANGYTDYRRDDSPNYINSLNTLFPPLAGRPAKQHAAIKEPSTWSPEAIALVEEPVAARFAPKADRRNRNRHGRRCV